MRAGAVLILDSGQTTERYRRNRYGDRQLNRAVHAVAQRNARDHNPPAARAQSPWPTP